MMSATRPPIHAARACSVLMSLLVGCLLLGQGAGVASADDHVGDPAEPMFELVDIFNAGDAGYRTYRIPALSIAPDGTLIALCAGRFDGHSDWVNIDTWIRRSTDGGKTWTEPQIVTDDGQNLVENATMIVDHETGEVHLMYQILYQRAYHKVSKDNGATWSPPREITYVFDVFRERENYKTEIIAMGPGHGIVLDSGRYVVPIWLSTSHAHRPSIISTVYSDDQGETWQAGDIIARNTEHNPNPSEHVLIQLDDGRVMSNIRCESKKYRRLQSFSKDGATGWSEPQFHEGLFDPICFASMRRHSSAKDGGKSRILFANPYSEDFPEVVLKWGARQRRNLTMRLSYDEGKTWPVSKVIESGRSGYSDIAVAPDGTIYCMFERGGLSEKLGAFAPSKMTVARFNLAWLTDGKDTGADE